MLAAEDGGGRSIGEFKRLFDRHIGVQGMEEYGSRADKGD